MKKILFFLLFIPSAIFANEAETAASQLVARLFNNSKQASQIVFKQKTDTKDFFELYSNNNKIIIEGNNANSMAVGLSHYLKYYCKTSVSWYALDPIEMPDKLPMLKDKVRINSRVQNRFFLNYCTFGYTMTWWTWKDWERFIDWMALNGVNLPLAITGQESIWHRVWLKLGLDDNDIRNYFTGPAHLPWHRMTNMDKWQGGLPDSWLNNQEELQKKIVARERELGMKPVLPAFAGHVPQALTKKYPSAKISMMSSWGGFEDEYRSFFLDPLDPLFSQIQKLFLEEQTKVYGTDHIYGADPFNEIESPSWEPDYLATVAKTIYGTMTQTDKDATWLQMTWLFYNDSQNWTSERINAFVNAVPKGKMLLLDYYAENTEIWRRTQSYFGQSFLWCYLGNFGGNTMLAGNITKTGKRIDETLQYAGDNFTGIGSTLEALDVNPLMYEYVFEKAWDNNLNDSDWITAWADRRTGLVSYDNRKVWQDMLSTIYNESARLGQGSLINSRPCMYGYSYWTNPKTHYNPTALVLIWKEMLSVAKSLKTYRDSYIFDIVNVGRQVLGNHFYSLRGKFAEAYAANNIEDMQKYGKLMEETMTNVEELLSCHQTFSYHNWMQKADDFGINDKEKQYYRTNAATLITTWGHPNQALNEYANRTWSGLTEEYYHKRWTMFIQDVISKAKLGQNFDQRQFNVKMFAFEQQFINQAIIPTEKPHRTPEQVISLANQIFNSIGGS